MDSAISHLGHLPEPPGCESSDTHIIAAALIWPNALSANILAADLFGAAVVAGMSNIGLEAGSPVSFGGPLWIGFYCRVEDRNRGLLALMASLMGLRTAGIRHPIKVGFYCNAELIWRSVTFDDLHTPDFSDYVKEDVMAAWKGRVQCEAAVMLASIQAGTALAKIQPPGAPLEPTADDSPE